MTVSYLVEESRRALEEYLRRWKFKKANAERARTAELQAAQIKCRGQLEVCKKDFSRLIRQQSATIREGTSLGMDIELNKQVLWDAAIGYMMVKDAIFALNSVNSFDGVNKAYGVMGAVLDNIIEREKKALPISGIRIRIKRNAEGGITFEDAVNAKAELLTSFFDTLVETGDIEACMESAKTPAAVSSERRASYMDKARPESGAGSAKGRWSILDADDDESDNVYADMANLDTMDDIHRSAT